LELSQQISAILSVVSVIIAISIGIGTLRQRANEPNEKRWQEYEKWKGHIDENFTTDNKERWKDFDNWRDGIDDKLSRDYSTINSIRRKIKRRDEFESLMLYSIRGILEHLATGNHNEMMKDMSKKIDKYLIDTPKYESDMD